MLNLVFRVPLSLLQSDFGHNFHVKESWMTQSAGGPHSSFQPIIQMERTIHVGSLQLSFSSLHAAGQVCAVSYASHLSCTWQLDCYQLSCQHNMKENELSCSSKRTRGLITPAVWGAAGVAEELEEIMKGYISWRFCCQSRAFKIFTGLRKCHHPSLW